MLPPQVKSIKKLTLQMFTQLMGLFNVHVFSNYVPDAELITSLECHPRLSLLAVARGGDKVEVWLKKIGCYLWKTYYTRKPGRALVTFWYLDRLFCFGVEGMLLELSPHAHRPSIAMTLPSRDVQCVAKSTSGTVLAFGSKDGTINFVYFDKTANHFVAGTSLHNTGSVVSLAWNPADELLASGSVNCISVWRVLDRKCLYSLRLGGRDVEVGPTVYSLSFMGENVLVSGDSSGFTSFWDTDCGVLLQSYKCHRAEVRSVKVDENGEHAYSSGNDPTIFRFTLAENGSFSRDGVLFVNKRTVNQLDTAGGWLVSGGEDCFLAFSKEIHGKVVRRKFYPYVQEKVKCASDCGLVMFQHKSSLSIWKLGSATTSSDSPFQMLALSQHPREIVRMDTGGEPILFSAISPDGICIACSTITKTSLFRLWPERIDESTGMCKYSELSFPSKLPPSSQLCLFRTKECIMFAVADRQSLALYRVLTNDVCPCVCDLSLPENFGCVQKMVASWCGDMLAMITSSFEISILNINSKAFIATPKVDAYPVDVAFSSSDGYLLILYDSGLVLEFDSGKSNFTDFSNSSLGAKIRSLWRCQPLGLAISSSQSGFGIAYGATQLFSIDKTQASSEARVKEINQWNWLFAAHFLTNGDLVLCCSEVSAFNELLPKPLNFPKFGRK
uniref:WD_REPEATS_REGION domain-containing protein n=1 Tax=Trichuris muris TaxID=70415 RepID=A0A5S6QN42_TRIMR